MVGPRATRIRRLLRSNLNGLTTREIAEQVGVDPSNVMSVLRRMPDAYICRWVPPVTLGPWQSVWACITPPPHAPRPSQAKSFGDHA